MINVNKKQIKKNSILAFNKEIFNYDLKLSKDNVFIKILKSSLF